MTVDELLMQIVKLRDKAAEVGDDNTWAMFATAERVISALTDDDDEDEEEA